ncbi:hypothetical protein G7Y41_03055 [Schaalia sp. ZJ405]|uniref:hypothetical protein n=1 Tax=Schaalia sp. ZJ405 TaxID=2709403 RepID=UPI0013EB92C9|nr:hypothetical protein [Schaalia sp. ZJ405]QPK81817.1 hypothetical protein G7Y41_03055 [Schaalia sp. ZJ405]
MTIAFLGACTAQHEATPIELYRPDAEKLHAEVQDVEPTATILADGVITESEMTELKNTIIQCVADRGFHLSFGSQFNDFAVRDNEFGESGMDALNTCDEELFYSDTESIYFKMTTNPTKLPHEQVIIDCLIRNKAVEPVYTKERYHKDIIDWIHRKNAEGKQPIEGIPGEALTYIGDPEKGLDIYLSCVRNPAYSSTETSQS